MKLTAEEKQQYKTLCSDYCRLEIFYSKRTEQAEHTCFYDHDLKRPMGSGFYFWFCAPGCLPEGEPCGPYKSRTDAIKDAVNMFGNDYDPYILNSTINTE